MRKASDISNEIYDKAMAINNNIADSIIGLDINDEDLHDLQEGEEVHVYVEIRLVTC